MVDDAHTMKEAIWIDIMTYYSANTHCFPASTEWRLTAPDVPGVTRRQIFIVCPAHASGNKTGSRPKDKSRGRKGE